MTGIPNKPPALRLALRREGDWWVAYLAEAQTMDGAFEIGRVLFGAVITSYARQREFMALMQAIMTDAIHDRFGVRATGFEIRPAPEHEKAGRA
jgi:hypothetical protein